MAETTRPSVYDCWVSAGGGTPEYDRDRYAELLREHGHVVPAKPGEDRNLPCGWPGNTP